MKPFVGQLEQSDAANDAGIRYDAASGLWVTTGWHTEQLNRDPFFNRDDEWDLTVNSGSPISGTIGFDTITHSVVSGGGVAKYPNPNDSTYYGPTLTKLIAIPQYGVLDVDVAVMLYQPSDGSEFINLYLRGGSCGGPDGTPSAITSNTASMGDSISASIISASTRTSNVVTFTVSTGYWEAGDWIYVNGSAHVTNGWYQAATGTSGVTVKVASTGSNYGSTGDTGSVSGWIWVKGQIQYTDADKSSKNYASLQVAAWGPNAPAGSLLFGAIIVSHATGFSKTFTVDGTFYKPRNAKSVYVEMLGGGGGGGSGRRGAAGSIRQGGGGGAGGSSSRSLFDGLTMSETIPIQVGTAGSGGAAQTSNNSAGNGGGDGGSSIFGNTAQVFLRAGGGSGGDGGQAGGAGGVTASAVGLTSGGDGGVPSATGTSGGNGGSTSGSLACAAAGGGAGGGITSGDSNTTGGDGGFSAVYGQTSMRVSGAAVGANGGGGPSFTNNTVKVPPVPGGGGAGGGKAGNGGAGGLYGAGGGGGGANLNGSNSGAGGAGAAGYVFVSVVM